MPLITYPCVYTYIKNHHQCWSCAAKHVFHNNSLESVKSHKNLPLVKIHFIRHVSMLVTYWNLFYFSVVKRHFEMSEELDEEEPVPSSKASSSMKINSPAKKKVTKKKK